MIKTIHGATFHRAANQFFFDAGYIKKNFGKSSAGTRTISSNFIQKIRTMYYLIKSFKYFLSCQSSGVFIMCCDVIRTLSNMSAILYRKA